MQGWLIGKGGGVMNQCTECERQGVVLFTANHENEYGELICVDCEANAAERAYERHCEDFHDGGSTKFKSLQQQQIEARKLK